MLSRTYGSESWSMIRMNPQTFVYLSIVPCKGERRDPNSEPVHNVPVSDPTRVSSSEREPPVQMSPGASSGGERADSAEGGGGYTRLPTHSYILLKSWLRDSIFPSLSGMFSSS